MTRFALPAVCVMLGGLACGAAPRQARAETLVEFSAETQMQLDFHVPDAALAAMLPAGFAPSIATAGPAKDANLRMVFIDRGDITGPDNKPLGRGSNQLVYLIIPIKQVATGTVGQLVLAGITADPADAPGPFGVYLPASTHRMQRSTVAGGSAPLTEEHWEFAAASGERMEVHLKYERRGAPKAAAELKFFSGQDPAKFQIFKYERGLDIMRNATVNVGDRVSEFSYKASGGRIGALFDGSERVLSIDAIHWSNRAAYAP
ncbi:MAG TPA: hypothetical protein VFU97_00250 [Xanthobacteraceae bacterium]|nr:hypothetical protein [Xanthobacteraceae bacterium]